MMWLPNSRWTWSFALIAVAQAIIALAIEGYVFAQFEVNLRPNSRGTSASHSVPTYLALFIFGFLYQLVLVYDALRAKNTIQVIGLCLYNVGMVIYSGVQIAQVKEAIDGLIKNVEGDGIPQIEPDIWDKIALVPTGMSLRYCSRHHPPQRRGMEALPRICLDNLQKHLRRFEA
jgi:hypothetical protein